jgi:hypothetical protein
MFCWKWNCILFALLYLRKNGREATLFARRVPTLLKGGTGYFAAGDSLRVRHVALDGIPDCARKHSEGGVWVIQPRLSSKDKGERSMLKTQRSPEDMDGEALQDPHPMARARLPELQFPVGVAVLPSGACLKPMPC